MTRIATSPSQDDADKVINYGLHLMTNGERAPGGDETWAEFGRMAEDYLRRRLCADRGFHTPPEPECPDCKLFCPACHSGVKGCHHSTDCVLFR